MPPDQMQLKHNLKMYPPCVIMTVTLVNITPFKLDVKVTGCSITSENQLDRDITFPLGNQTIQFTVTSSKLL